MKEILITSSVLILVLLAVRLLFFKSISRRAQYALWGLVLVRLLVPVSLPAMEHSVLSAVEPMQTAVAEQMDGLSVYLRPVAQGRMEMSALQPPESNAAPAVVVREDPSRTGGGPQYQVNGHTAAGSYLSEDGTVVFYAWSLTVPELLALLWLIGTVLMSVWFLTVNLLFWRKLRKARSPYTVDGCGYPVYLVERGLPSPCLFGLFRPAIYLTPAATASPEALRHVIAHESTHARHLDCLWSLLRCVCLAVYWFDPLVWAAAIVSRSDCELACDEGALKTLGEAERISYGKTLLSLIPVGRGPGNPLLSATTMTAGKRQLKDRITRIAENRQTRAAALFAVIAAAAVACALTFTGSSSPAGKADLSGFELETTISLAEAEPCTPEAVPITDIPKSDVAWVLDYVELPSGGVVGCGYLEDRSAVYWYADSREAETLHLFLTNRSHPYDYGYAAKTFTGVLGHDGFRVVYEAGEDLEPHTGQDGNVYNALRYYYFGEDGTLYLLASAPGDVTEAPWPDTLLANAYGAAGTLLYFQRDGGLYRAELTALIAAAYPGWDSAGVGWDGDSRLLGISGYRESDYALCRRSGDFDGKNLLIYKDARALNDHVLGAPNVPEDVLAAAKSSVSQSYQQMNGSGEQGGNTYDDWRVEHLAHAYTYSPADGTDFYGMEIEVYQMNYEFHTPMPLDQVVLAGGMYVTEDGWVMPSYPYCTYLLFQIKDGQRVFLYSVMENDCAPGIKLFTEDMERAFLSAGNLTVAGMTQAELAEMFRQHPVSALAKVSACYGMERDLGCRVLAWSLAEEPIGNIFGVLNQEGFTGRMAQTLDLLRYYAGDLSYDTLPQEVLDLYKQVRDAWENGRSSGESYMYFADEEHRDLYLNAGANVPRYIQIEFGRWINPSLYAVTAYVTDYDGTPAAPYHRCYFAGLIDGTWKWIGHVSEVPEALREGLDAERYDYYETFFPGDGSNAKDSQPPTEEDLHNAILTSRKNASGKTFDFYAEAHQVLDRVEEGDACTFYLMVDYEAYSSKDGVWTPEVGGQFPAAATFTRQDGEWVLSEYWEPLGGGRYEPDIRGKFTEQAADALFNGDWSYLKEQCDNAALRYFTQAENRGSADAEAAVAGAAAYLPELQKKRGYASLVPVSTEIDAALSGESRAHLAEINGWSTAYAARLTVVRAVYDVTWDGGAGRAARNIYMMPESGTGGSWYVYGAQDCAVPAEFAYV